MRWPWQFVALGAVVLLHAIGVAWWRRARRPRTYHIRTKDGSVIQVTDLGPFRPNKRLR